MKIKISYCDREPRFIESRPFGIGYEPVDTAQLIFAAFQGVMAVSDGEDLDPADTTFELIDDDGSTLFHQTAESLEFLGLPGICQNIPHFKPQGGK